MHFKVQFCEFLTGPAAYEIFQLPSHQLFLTFSLFLELLVDHFQSSEEISQEQDEKRQGQHEHLKNEIFKCKNQSVIMAKLIVQDEQCAED